MVKLKYKYLIALVLFVAYLLSISAQAMNEDTEYSDDIFENSVIDTTFGEDRFFTHLIYTYNHAKDTLKINRVTASCYCSSATVLNSEIAPGDTGRVMLYINREGLTDANSILFRFHTSRSSDPTLRIIFDDI